METFDTTGHTSLNAAARPRVSATVIIQRTLIGSSAVLMLLTVFALDIMIAQFARDFDFLPAKMADLFARGSVIPVVFVGIVLVGVFELDRLFRLKGVRPHTTVAYVFVAAMMLAPWFSAAGWFGPKMVAVEGWHASFTVMIVGVIAAFAASVSRFDPHDSLRDVGATALMLFYLGFLSSFAMHIRCDVDRFQQDGAWLLLLLLLIIKATDIGGFFVGSAFGRHKLIPSISPAKSIEGAIGGIVASVLVALAAGYFGAMIEPIPNSVRMVPVGEGRLDLLGFVDGLIRPMNWKSGPFGLPKFPGICLFATAVSLAAQLGDLIESSFKRDAGRKDSGDLIPRAGGILDLIDSPLTAIPIAWLLLTFVRY